MQLAFTYFVIGKGKTIDAGNTDCVAFLTANKLQNKL